jgi:hypothetical protein
MKFKNYADEIDEYSLTVDEAQEYAVWLMLEFDEYMEKAKQYGRISVSRDETKFMNDLAQMMVRKTWLKLKDIQTMIDFLHERYGV